MSSQHPWSIFARGAGGSDPKVPPKKQDDRGGNDGNSSDEDEDIPTTAAVGTQGSLCSMSSSKSLKGCSGAGSSGEVSLRADFEASGVSDELIGKVEDMLMDHFYRVEASVFKVECGLKAQTQMCEEQQRYMHDLSERVSRIAASQRSDRTRLQEMSQAAKDQADQSVQPTVAPAQHAAASSKVSSGEVLDSAQHDRLLSGLRQDFDEQMARHEDRFASFETALHKCTAELAALRADLAIASPKSAVELRRGCRPSDAGAQCKSVLSRPEEPGPDAISQQSRDLLGSSGCTNQDLAAQRSRDHDCYDSEHGNPRSQQSRHALSMQKAIEAV